MAQILSEAHKAWVPNEDTRPDDMILIASDVLDQIQTAAFVPSKILWLKRNEMEKQLPCLNSHL